MAPEQIATGSKKVRGRAQASLDLIEAMADIAEAAEPITGRGIGYQLFSKGLIPSMATAEMAKVYRLLKEARESGIIPWGWIVDETRRIEREPTWDDPAEYIECVHEFLPPRFLERATGARRMLERERHRSRRRCPHTR